VQLVIPLRDRIRFLPRSKTLAGARIWLYETIWPLWSSMQNTSVLSPPWQEAH